MERFNLWLWPSDTERMREFQYRTGMAMSEQIRMALHQFALHDPVVSGQRIEGLFAKTESGMVQLGWIKA